MRCKVVIFSTLIVLALAVVSCSVSRTRKFVPCDQPATAPVAGWIFEPDIQSYHYTNKKGAPADSSEIWLNLTAHHPPVSETDTLFGVDIDTVHMSMAGPGTDEYVWVKHASAYGDPLEYKRLVRRFRFQDPSGGYHFYVPDEVDTLFIEFEAKFYRGILRTLKPNSEYSSANDTVIVDTSDPENFTRTIRMKLIKKVSSTLVPAFH
jgi:hypothetical protein